MILLDNNINQLYEWINHLLRWPAASWVNAMNWYEFEILINYLSWSLIHRITLISQLNTKNSPAQLINSVFVCQKIIIMMLITIDIDVKIEKQTTQSWDFAFSTLASAIRISAFFAVSLPLRNKKKCWR